MACEELCAHAFAVYAPGAGITFEARVCGLCAQAGHLETGICAHSWRRLANAAHGARWPGGNCNEHAEEARGT